MIFYGELTWDHIIASMKKIIIVSGNTQRLINKFFSDQSTLVRDDEENHRRDFGAVVRVRTIKWPAAPGRRPKVAMPTALFLTMQL